MGRVATSAARPVSSAASSRRATGAPPERSRRFSMIDPLNRFTNCGRYRMSLAAACGLIPPMLIDPSSGT